MATSEFDEVKAKLKQIIQDCISKGPGYAQAGVVLRLAKDELQPQSLEDQQLILDVWQSFFQDGELAWGYNLDNPSFPFFHMAVHQSLGLPR